MADKEAFEFKNPFTARMSEDEWKVNNEKVFEIFCDFEPANLTNRFILNGLIERASMKVRKNSEPRKEDLDTIQNLTNEIGRLKTLIDLKDDELLKVNKLYSEKNQLAIALETELNGKIDEVENIKTAVPNPKAIVLMFPEKAKTLLNLACSRIAQRTKQEVTPDLLLWDLFWDYVRGIADHKYPFVIKSSDLKEPKHE
jgi:hypothetical protein